MNPIWRALFVSTESAKAHLWELRPLYNFPDRLRSLCRKVRVVNGLALEPERADRGHCRLCERALQTMRDEVTK